MWSSRDMWMPGGMYRRMWRRMWRRRPGDHPWRGNMSSRMQRHWTFMHGDIPRQYRGVRSTIKVNAANIAAGGKLYQTHCAACHGKAGLGDGEAGKALSPSPALLAHMIQRPVAVDEFLLWSISEGGKQFKTDMPAYKDVLKPQDIWQIVAWMRAGFPAVKSK